MNRAVRLAHLARTLLEAVLESRALLLIIYAAGLICGVGMVIYSPLTISHELGGQFTDLIGWLITAASAICFASQLLARIRWRWEKSGLWLLSTAIAMYAGIAWLLTWTSWPGRIVEATLTSMLALMMAAHLRDLYRFDRETRDAPTGPEDGPDDEH